LRSDQCLLLVVTCVAACGSGPNPSATGGDAASVLVASGGAFVGSAVTDGQGNVYAVSDEVIQQVTFAPGSVLSSPWSAPSSQPEIELAVGGGALWWAANDGTNHTLLWTVGSQGFVVSPSPSATFPGSYGGDGGGRGAAPPAGSAAAAAPKAATAGVQPVSPDSGAWPGTSPVGTAFAGDLYEVPTHPAGMPVRLGNPAGATTFLPGTMQHVLAQGAGQVYWVDSTPSGSDLGRVMAAQKAAWGTDPGHAVGTLQSIDGLPLGFVGIAATETDVVWAAAPQPPGSATGCWIWVSHLGKPAVQIVDSDLASPAFTCNGLAVDGDYVYFAVVQPYVPPAGASSTAIVGTAVARAPLSGGGVQEASLQSDRWYGPRRVIVDSTYVYAIDPSYVLRLPKSDFGP
jgi:hypothetical protein